MFWEAVNKYGIRIWLERVPTGANVADRPSRQKEVGRERRDEGDFGVYEEFWGSMEEMKMASGAGRALNPLGFPSL